MPKRKISGQTISIIILTILLLLTFCFSPIAYMKTPSQNPKQEFSNLQMTRKNDSGSYEYHIKFNIFNSSDLEKDYLYLQIKLSSYNNYNYEIIDLDNVILPALTSKTIEITLFKGVKYDYIELSNNEDSFSPVIAVENVVNNNKFIAIRVIQIIIIVLLILYLILFVFVFKTKIKLKNIFNVIFILVIITLLATLHYLENLEFGSFIVSILPLIFIPLYESTK